MKPGIFVWLRRVSQAVFLVLFLFLLINTQLTVSSAPDGTSGSLSLPYPVGIFHEIDPLSGIMSALASHTLYGRMALCLIIVIPTLFLGRFFCGWICPLGTINHIASRTDSRSREKKRKMNVTNRWKPWFRSKYIIFWGMTGAALLGSLQFGLLDPISLATRSLGLSYIPAFTEALHRAMTALYNCDIRVISYGGDAIHYILKHGFMMYDQPYYRGALLFGLIFTAVLILNRYMTRFWCRAVCPLGALLALLSRWSVFGIRKNHSKCIECMKCVTACQGACEPKGNETWIKHECLLCMNCQSVCPADVIKFGFSPDEEERTGTMPGRRAVLGSLVAGIAFSPLARTAGIVDSDHDPLLMRPPGSVSEIDFLSKCIRCGECMKVCPTNVIQPTLFEAGLEGLWTPVLIMKMGYCEYSCVLCSTVCPTGAIQLLTEARKLGKDGKKPVSIGTAFIDRGKCLPWGMAVPCIVCEEHCPTSPKAVYLRDETVFNLKGEPVDVKQPFVDPELCIGCGVCEFKCPVKNSPAIYCNSTGESRSPENQILLAR